MTTSIPQALLLLLSSLALSSGAAAAVLPLDSRALETTRHLAARAGLSITENHHTLTRIRRPPGHPRTLDALLYYRRNGKPSSYPAKPPPPHNSTGDDGGDYDDDDDDAEGVAGLSAELNQVEYLMRAAVGGQEFRMIPDTGSSDTWVARAGFRCLDPFAGRPVGAEACGFGALYEGGEGGEFPGGNEGVEDTEMRISYLSGDFLNGPMGFADVTLANITVARQQISLVDVASFEGDGLSSGILGLGLRGLTSAFRATERLTSEPAPYSPLLETMGASGAADPVVSFAMSRDESRSYIAFGGVPPVTTGEYAVVPIQKSTHGNETDYFYYDIAIDAIRWSSSPSNSSSSSSTSPIKNGTATNLPNMLVDSGTTINLFPSVIAAAINGAFRPPGRPHSDGMAYIVACDAEPPELEVEIGGMVIRTDRSSMILPETEKNGRCLSGIGAGDDAAGGTYILGDTFMQELVVVFDTAPDRMEMKFAMRTGA